jgi:hypothetical protein
MDRPLSVPWVPLLFGPRIGVEVGAGHVTGALMGRWFNGGLVVHKMSISPLETARIKLFRSEDRAGV